MDETPPLTNHTKKKKKKKREELVSSLYRHSEWNTLLHHFQHHDLQHSQLAYLYRIYPQKHTKQAIQQLKLSITQSEKCPTMLYWLGLWHKDQQYIERAAYCSEPRAQVYMARANDDLDPTSSLIMHSSTNSNTTDSISQNGISLSSRLQRHKSKHNKKLDHKKNAKKRKERMWHWLWNAAWNGECWAWCRIGWALESGDQIVPDYIWSMPLDELRRRWVHGETDSDDLSTTESQISSIDENNHSEKKDSHDTLSISTAPDSVESRESHHHHRTENSQHNNQNPTHSEGNDHAHTADAQQTFTSHSSPASTPTALSDDESSRKEYDMQFSVNQNEPGLSRIEESLRTVKSDSRKASSNDVAERYRRAMMLYEMASARDYDRGHYLLARCLKNLHSIGVSGNKTKKSNGDDSQVIDSQNDEVLQRAKELFAKAARKYPPAMNDLASLCLYSKPEEAFQLFKRASNLGLLKATFNLGVCYLNGYGVEPNIKEAIRCLQYYFFHTDSTQGHMMFQHTPQEDNQEDEDSFLQNTLSEAEYQVGLRYFNGNGVSLDKCLAISWFRRSAENGNSNAQYKLALSLANGDGVEQDKDEAVKWYRAASEQGHREALNNLGVCLRSGVGCEKNETEAAKCYESAAKKNNRIACANLASCYENGIGVEKDLKQAFYWYKRSADLGYPKGITALGFMHENGMGCKKSPKKAKRLYLKAAEMGYSRAMNNIGCLCRRDGHRREAIAWFERASAQNYSVAQFNLACMYASEKGGESRASEYFKKAADQGYANAQYRFAWCLETGTGVEKDMKLALRYYDLAAKSGHAASIKKVNQWSDQVEKCFQESGDDEDDQQEELLERAENMME